MTTPIRELPGLPIHIIDRAGNVIRTTSVPDPREVFCRHFNRPCPADLAHLADGLRAVIPGAEIDRGTPAENG